jgi:predicted dehydrogenase
MKTPKFRIGIAGLGAGQSHLKAFQELPDWFEVAAVCDIDLQKAKKVQEENGLTVCTGQFEDLLGMDLDIIDIATPSFLHHQQAMATLAAGKHVILEKPAAGSLREVDEIQRAIEKSGLLLMPIFQQRFGRGLQKLKFLLDQGIPGKPILVTAETAWRRRPEYYTTWHGRWQTELGGALVTLGIHAHDQVCSVLGPPASVMAHIATLVNPIETEDTAAISLRMRSGALASFAVTTGSSRETTRLRFCFSNLTAEGNPEPYSPSCEPWTFTGDTPQVDSQIQEALAGFVPLPEKLTGQFHHFYQSLARGAALPVSIADARVAVELLSAIYLSASTQRAVDLPIPLDHPYYQSWRPQPI